MRKSAVRKRAFTLIELLVVVAVIALLISILLPALSGARERGKRIKCQSNLRTIGHSVQYYLQENGDRFPDAPFYGCLGYIGRCPYQGLLGTQTPESQRPMNRYFGVTDDPVPGSDPNDPQQAGRQRNDLFECPSDKGDAYPYPYFSLPGKFFLEHGTSYTYASSVAGIPVPTYGVLSCRNLRATLLRWPSKKIVFQEPVFAPALDCKDYRAHWHARNRPHGNLLFADGHVEFRFPTIFEPYFPPDENEPYY